MLFANSRQMAVTAAVAASMLWLGIRYREDHPLVPPTACSEPRIIPALPAGAEPQRLPPADVAFDALERFDSQVRATAAYESAPLAIAMTAIGQQAPAPRITKITSGSLSFAAPASDGWYWLGPGNLTVAGDQTPAGTVTLRLLKANGDLVKELGSATVENQKPWTIDTGAPLPSDDQYLGVHIKTSDNKESDIPTVRVHVPADGDPPSASVSHAFNAKHAKDPTPSGANGILLYGPSPYLRLEGQDFAANVEKLRFYLFDNTGLLKQEITNARVTRDPKIPGAWRAEMNLPATPTAVNGG